MTFDDFMRLEISEEGESRFRYSEKQLEKAFIAGRSDGIAWAERFTAEQCAEIAHNWRDSKTGISCSHRLDIEAVIKKKFGLEI